MDSFPVTLPELLQWLINPAGAWLVISWFASWSLEKWPKWADLNATLKRWLMAGLALALSAGSTWLLDQPVFMDAVAPVYAYIATFIMAWLSLETVHKVNKRLTQ